MSRRRLGDIDDDPVSIEFLDVIFCVLLPVAFVALVSVIHINPPPLGEYEKVSKLAPSALYAQIGWKFNEPHDVDTYLRCSSHVNGCAFRFTVNFKQKVSGFLDMGHDDLGKPSANNHETAMTNSKIDQLPPNTVCVLNAHLYSSRGGTIPLSGVFHVILNKDNPDEEILTTAEGLPYELRHKGEEVTLMQLVINEDGQVMRDATLFFPETPFVCLATC